jgi:CO dehydrogenase maturation factor
MTANEMLPLDGKRLGILGKGGSGKSTIVVLLARALRRRGYEVCILDADSTNVGLHRALGFERTPAALIEYYGGMVFSGGRVTCPVDDPTPLADPDVSLDELPVEYYSRNEDGIYLLVGGKIAAKGPGAGCDGPISKIARDVRIKGREDHTLTLIDFKAGFEDSARGVLTSLDWAIEIVDPTTAAMQMAVNLKEMVKQIRAGQPPATRHLDVALAELAKRIFKQARIKGVLVVLNRITDEEVESYMKEELKKNGIEPIGTIREEPSITAAWLRGAPLRADQSSKGVEQIVNALEAAERPASVGIHPSEAA